MNFEQEKNWRKDPKNWKLGIFYFNKKDNRVFVEKRNPFFGITLNFSNKKSCFTIVAIILFFGFIVYKILNFEK